MVWNKKAFFYILAPMLGLGALGVLFLDLNSSWHESLAKPALALSDWALAALGGVCCFSLWLAAYITLSHTRRMQYPFTYLLFCCLAGLFSCLPYLYFEKRLLVNCLMAVSLIFILSIVLLFRLYDRRERSAALLLPAFFYSAYLIVLHYGAVMLN
ncbi:MAG: tryptophan-rich sensory protein [Christensenellales bacterium]